MRIISGNHKGKKIQAPKSLPVRPTTDRAKESVFNILENRYNLSEKKILDLFSGTGNLSYEFSSRNTYEITAVDINPKCVNFIKKTNQNLNFNIKTILSDSFKFIEKTDKNFDIIFMDPPYNYKRYHDLKDLIIERKILNKDGCLIIEHDKTTRFDEKNIEVRKYGSVFFTMFNI